MKKRWTDNLAPEDQFNLPDFAAKLGAEGKKIGAIVDINFSENYYTWNITLCKNRDLLSKVEFRKVKVAYDELPRKRDMDRVYDVLNKHAFDDSYTIIHCTHGVHRTGYAICYFLCKKFSLKSEEAIRRFEEARGYPLKYNDLKQDLADRFD